MNLPNQLRQISEQILHRRLTKGSIREFVRSLISSLGDCSRKDSLNGSLNGPPRESPKKSFHIIFPKIIALTIRGLIFAVAFSGINGVRAHATVSHSVNHSVDLAVTLDQAYQTAIKQTESIAIEKSRLVQTEERVGQSRGALFPNLSAQGNYLHQSGTNRATRRSLDSDQSYGRLTLVQPLYAGGLASARRETVKAEQKAQNQAVARVTHELYNQVARSFFAVRISEEEVRNLETSIRLTEERVAELNRRARIGRARPGEVLSAQSQLGVLKAQAQLAQANLQGARDQFAYATGMDRNTQLSSTDLSIAKPPPLEEHLKLISQNADILRLEALREAAQSEVREAKSRNNPTLDLTANSYLFRTGTDQDVDWDVGLTLKIPIYEGGIVQSQVRESKERETEAELRLRGRQRELESQIRMTYNALLGALEQTDSLKAALALAEKNYREQTRDYRFGLVTNLDVLQAMNTLQEAKRTWDRTRLQAQLHRAELDALTSHPPRGSENDHL